MQRYEEYVASSRFAGRPQHMVDNDYEVGHMARDARWRAARNTSAQDVYHMEDRERIPNVSSSSRSRNRSNRSADVPSRQRSPGYSNRRHVTEIDPSSRRSNTSSDRYRSTTSSSDRYGYIPVAYNPTPVRSSSTRQRSSAVPIYDRFDDDDAESDRSAYSSWSGYRRSSGPDPDARYGVRLNRRPYQVDQTERERERYHGSRATSARPFQTQLLPLETVRRVSASQSSRLGGGFSRYGSREYSNLYD